MSVIFNTAMLIGGCFFAIEGYRSLFVKGYVEKKWPGDNDKKNDPLYFYGKYVRGTGTLIAGLMLMGFSIYQLSDLFK